jgi:hypothetical protein
MGEDFTLGQSTLGGPPIGVEDVVEGITTRFDAVMAFLQSPTYNVIYYFLWALSAYFLLTIAYMVYAQFRIGHLEMQELLKEERGINRKKREAEKITPKIEMRARGQAIWARVQTHLQGEGPSDWKLAILEADTILDRLLIDLEYKGDNLGERLKKVNRMRMRHLEDAWDAHKFRNRIAHDAAVDVTKDEALKITRKFANVFNEFDYI